MKITVRMTYALNGADETKRDLSVEVDAGFELTPATELDLMSKAGDALISRYDLTGQIMVSNVEMIAA
jgi:hypothetical protein